MKRTEEEIRALIKKALEAEGQTMYEGMTYEQGVHDALEWTLDRFLNSPLEETA